MRKTFCAMCGRRIVSHAWGKGGRDTPCEEPPGSIDDELELFGELPGGIDASGKPGNCCPGGSCARNNANCSALRACVAIGPASVLVPSPALACWRSCKCDSMRIAPERNSLLACRRNTCMTLNGEWRSRATWIR